MGGRKEWREVDLSQCGLDLSDRSSMTLAHAALVQKCLRADFPVVFNMLCIGESAVSNLWLDAG